jgi:SAM-dependent methyltransferase
MRALRSREAGGSAHGSVASRSVNGTTHLATASQDASEVRLNVGAGRTFIPGFVNVDISPKADVTLDLGRDRLPFDDDSVDLVFSYHTLEHVDDYLFALGEIHRVLKHGGRFLVGLPYATLTEFHLVNPYHRHNFNEHSFRFFDPGELKGSAAEPNAIIFREVFHRFHYMRGFHLTPPPLRTWCRRHLFNVVRKIDFGHLAVKDPERPLPADAVNPRAMKAEFDACFRARTPHGSKPAAAPDTLRGAVRRARNWWLGND